MAGLFGKLKTLIGSEDEEYYMDENEEEELDATKITGRSNRYGLDGDDAQYRHERTWEDVGPVHTYPRREPVQPRQREKVIQIQPTGNRRLDELTSRFNIMVIEPKDFDMCPKLVSSLKAKKPVIVNLERIETKTARKIFDFLCGATCALGGDLQKIANNIFVFLPENVDVTTNTEHTGMTFGSEDGNPWKL